MPHRHFEGGEAKVTDENFSHDFLSNEKRELQGS